MEATKKNKNKLKNKIILLTSFSVQFMNVSIILGLVYYLKIRLGLDAKQIGIVISINTISYFVSCILLINITEKITPIHCIEIGISILAIYSFLILLTENLVFICILQFFAGFAFSFVWPPLSGWLNRGQEGKSLSKTNSMFNLSWSSGSAFGPSFAGILVGQNIQFPFLFGGLFFLCLLIFLIIETRIHKEIRAEKSERKNSEEFIIKDKSTFLRYYSWIGLFLVFLIYTVINNIFPIYAFDILKMGSEFSGSLISIKGFVTLFSFWILGKTDWWHFKRFVIIGSQLVLALLCLSSAYLKSIFLLTVFFALVGILVAFMYETSLFHGMSGAKNKSRRMTIHELSLSLGTVGGNIAGGSIYNKFGYNKIMIFMVLVIGIFLLFEFFLMYIKHVKSDVKE